MRLPGRLRSTTLGDLLGALHRAGASGTLELACERTGRVHRVHLRMGGVSAVELDGAGPQLGEILRARGHVDEPAVRRSLLRAMSSRRLLGEVLVSELRIDPAVIDRALREQLVARLELLERLDDARVAFRVTARPPAGSLEDAPLGPKEFLRGRKRARAARPEDSARAILGVSERDGVDAIKRAYRKLARELHPDAHPHASERERRELGARFAAVTEAYKRLCA